jgi:NAD(P)-dependent dehydrogenase (short-subunit alcohol dehydrogenase family)
MVNFSEFDMSGKITLVTGAAGLLGKAHCEALLEAGSIVIATDIDTSIFNESKFVELQKVHSDYLIFKKLDVTQKECCTELNHQLKKDNLIVTTLINNATINPSVNSNGLKNLGRLEDFSADLFEKEVAVGLTGAINCASVFGAEMAANGYGNILNIASDLAVIAPSQFLYTSGQETENTSAKKPMSYSSIKHGLIGVTKYLATYFEGAVRCNALSPGGVYVNQPKEFVDKLERLIPLKRMATVDEYKGAIKFMCSDASKYMNGHNLIIDGGRTVW